MFKITLLTIIFNILVIKATALENTYIDKSQLKLKQIVSENTFKKVGTAKFTYLLWDIYESELMTTSGKFTFNDQQQLLYKVTYLRDIKASDLIQETKKQWQHLGVKKEVYQPYLSNLKSIWPDIQEGDSLTLFYNKDSSAFYYNNGFIGEYKDQQFAKLFLDIWLSPNTSEPQLRKKLLGEL